MNARTTKTLQPVHLVNSAKACEMLCVSRATLARITEPNGSLKAVRIGNGRRPLLRYSVADIERWVDQRRQESRTVSGDRSRIASIIEQSSGYGALQKLDQ